MKVLDILYTILIGAGFILFGAYAAELPRVDEVVVGYVIVIGLVLAIDGVLKFLEARSFTAVQMIIIGEILMCAAVLYAKQTGLW